MFALFLFTFKGNIQCAKKVLRLAMKYADGDKCNIVYSSPEAMVEFSGEKKSKLCLSTRQKSIRKSSRKVGVLQRAHKDTVTSQYPRG